MLWKARQYQWSFPGPVLVMGVVNVTPDSFSDGGRYFDREAAVRHALRLAEEGADLLDIGGESTRPGAEPVSEQEELNRVLPVLERLAASLRLPLSIDTQKEPVARAAVAAGASIINDVAAGREHSRMWDLVAETGCGYIAMHMQGDPRTMQQDPRYTDVVDEVNAFFAERLERFQRRGIDPDQVALDVGIGFGKTAEHNLTLLRRMGSFTKWNRPLVVGVSRKSFLGKITGAPLEERLAGGLACACWVAGQGAQVIRTHDVAATRQAVRVWDYLLKAQS